MEPLSFDQLLTQFWFLEGEYLAQGRLTHWGLQEPVNSWHWLPTQLMASNKPPDQWEVLQVLI